MRRAIACAAFLVLVPATSAFGADLGEILQRSGDSSYSAEQLITCSTPDGTRDALIDLKQSQGELRYGGVHESDVEVSAGYGGWRVESDGALLQSTTVEEDQVEQASLPSYTVDDGTPVTFLGRQATAYRLDRDGVTRAELVVDDDEGVVVSVTSFDADGAVYCERRFVSFDPTDPEWVAWDGGGLEEIPTGESANLPDSLDGFQRLDLYRDDSGLTFAYYSDGFFSFAVFESPSQVVLDDGNRVNIDRTPYDRQYNPGQVTYAWPTLTGWMALIGDLPPDMHQGVLSELERPYDPGLLRRFWRSIFG